MIQITTENDSISHNHVFKRNLACCYVLHYRKGICHFEDFKHTNCAILITAQNFSIYIMKMDYEFVDKMMRLLEESRIFY